jgi:hypothetical protein
MQVNEALESKCKSIAKEAKDMKRKGQIKAVFRIRVILIRIGILGSVLLITDPDPALFDSIFQDANKNYFLCLLFTVGTLTSVFKDNMS